MTPHRLKTLRSLLKKTFEARWRAALTRFDALLVADEQAAEHWAYELTAVVTNHTKADLIGARALKGDPNAPK